MAEDPAHDGPIVWVLFFVFLDIVIVGNVQCRRVRSFVQRIPCSNQGMCACACAWSTNSDTRAGKADFAVWAEFGEIRSG